MRVKAGWLIDGTGGPVQKDVLLGIHRGRLRSITPAHSEAFPEEDTLDCGLCTVIPGLVDAHVHLSMSGTEEAGIRRRQLYTEYEEAEGVIERHLKDHLCSGVVAVRDGGDHAGHTLRYRKERLKQSGIPLQVLVAGRAWHARGRYGRFIGRPPEDKATLWESIRRESPGTDHVKIVHSGLNSLLCFGKQTPPQFDRKDLADAVITARGLGLRVMIHANGETPVRDAVTSGCDSIEHGFFMGRENLTRMARQGITWVPTIYAMSACARTLAPGSREIEGAARNLKHQIRQLSEGIQKGVPVALGTDSGSLGVHHGYTVSDEMELFMQAGMTAEAAVRSATRNGAELLGLGDRLGCLIPGMPATFVVTRGGPDRLPAGLKPPCYVFIAGARQVPG